MKCPINILNGYLVCRLYVWNAKHWKTEYIEHFPKSFSERSTALSHVGRLSFITLDQCTAWWMARSRRRTGALHISVQSFWDNLSWNSTMNTITAISMQGLQCFWKMLQSLPWRPGRGINSQVSWKRSCTTVCSLVIFLRNLQTGGRGYLNVITWGLIHMKSNVPARYNAKKKETSGPLSGRIW